MGRGRGKQGRGVEEVGGWQRESDACIINLLRVTFRQRARSREACVRSREAEMKSGVSWSAAEAGKVVITTQSL